MAQYSLSDKIGSRGDFQGKGMKRVLLLQSAERERQREKSTEGERALIEATFGCGHCVDYV
jgi:hypothetical protein